MSESSPIALLKESFAHYSSHRASRMGAAISYYAIFAIIPLLSLMIVIAGYSLGHAYVETELTRQIGNFIGMESAEFIRSALLASMNGGTGIIVSIVSGAILIVGTLSMLRELKDSMDDLWDATIPEKRARGWGYFIHSRLISLSIIPVLVVLLLISLLFSAVVGIPSVNASVLLRLGDTAFSLAAASFLFAFIYRYLPNRKLPWKEIVYGAVITAILFLVGKFLIGLYISEAAGASAFGAAGAFIIILLWVYYSAQIFFFGASMTYVWSRKHGHLRFHE